MNFKSTIRCCSLFFLAQTLLWGSASAHHSTSHYANEVSEIEGTLVEIRWRNPHVYFFLKENNEDGSRGVWELEAGTLYNIERAGITSGLFSVGDEVRIAGNKSNTYDDKFWLENMLAANGEEYIFVARSSPRWNQTAIGGRQGWTNTVLETDQSEEKRTGISRVWSPAAPGTELAPGFTGNSLRSVATEEALAGRGSWDYSFDETCQAPGMPRANHSPHPHQFIDKGDTIEIFSEEFHQTRIVYMNNEIGAAKQPYSHLGYSTGAWQDENTLVIETNHINFPYMDLNGIRQSNQVSIQETYILNEDHSELEYTVVINDPIMLKEPYIKRGLWLDLNEKIDLEYRCVPTKQAGVE